MKNDMSMSFLGFTVAVYIQDLVLKKLATQTTPRSIDERLFTLYRGPGNGHASKKENFWTLSTLPQPNVIKKKKNKKTVVYLTHVSKDRDGSPNFYLHQV